MPTIQIIEDDAQIRKFLRISLEANGFDVMEARLAEDGLSQCAARPPDLVILDLGLPDISGQDVIARLREWTQVPIIVLSVRSDDDEKVCALDAGANDYVTKPFSITELMARIRVLLRTRERSADERSQYHLGDLEIDLAKRHVCRRGEVLAMSRKEFELLRCLAVRGGSVLTHQEILREIWGPAHVEDVHYLRVLVNHLRQKLEDDPSKPRYIYTVQGVGYRSATTSDGA